MRNETAFEPAETAAEGITRAISSAHLTRVESRLLRQLVEALIFEEITACDSSTPLADDAGVLFRLPGRTQDDGAVVYEARGRRMASFGRVRLDAAPVMRVPARGASTAAHLDLFVTEVLAQVQQGERLDRFVDELEQTLLKDAQAQALEPARELAGYDELEGDLRSGHTYHPCYKSRIGFTLADNARYGPEFKRPIRPVWIAVAARSSSVAESRGIAYEDHIRRELGERQYERFDAVIAAQGEPGTRYRIMPVHPWQWENTIVPRFHQALTEREIILLGAGDDRYRPQQSIRTLANVTAAEKPYLKLSLSITNTSTSRIMASHTVLNGPLITDWLHGLVRDDHDVREPAFVLLGEFVGVTYDYAGLPEHRRRRVHGTLGAVWRESLHPHLRPGEDGMPFNGLCHVWPSGVPLIDPWIRRYGLKAWTTQVLEATVFPVIHLLYAHGIGMESHSQNIVLLHRQGLPQRAALKDLHDGVRFSPAHLAEPDRCPRLVPESTEHALVNPHSFLITDDPTDVRDFSHDSFFFICLTELAMFLNEHFGLPEEYFWSTTAGIILRYQRERPQHQERYRLFDLFAETVRIEEMTRRRLFGDDSPHVRTVRNPLHPHRSVSPC
ncbi:IucA/IucC family siderophore biosynthesis protein [Micromonospora sp. HUAS LYJ1]|uniref:IucA/IucC family protein n=1 Tax=Micromonospora sp. HUAS LYJ1 TaxID=3061626 RepID=UPI00267171D9|nr:IucA/IucC family protein [Micromonospora sp. HUAS LYJ1]WKU07134.1 IucA/IucC family protein [Micromonospora sp. HUAS LYJ1]